MDPIDKIGLLKMDFLGLSNLTIMHNAVDIIEAVYGKKIDIEGLPLDDKKTFELLGRGETTGVFQLECLSGDTIISNTTIKTLYEKHHKTKLESIYVDEGKIHKNKIIKVIKGKSKKLFCLVTKNGRYIKASAEHNFLTTTGWKELKAIQPGDLLLQKIKAKHSTFNQCSTCKKQIDGQREGKSKFCYRCSALHYRNPSKLISRQKISNSRVRFYASGGEPWNKGMSKENNPILANTGLKISRALTGITYEDRYGLEEAQKRKALQSQAMSGKNNHMFGKKSPHAKGGYRPDLKHYVRSNWEADFARILKLSNLEYEYEPQTFSLTLPGNKPVNYTPDFYVPSLNTYYEIKGWMHDLDRQKIEAFTQQYPAIKLEVISATKFAEFALKYRDLVKWECPRIPAEQSFEFIEVEKILPAGIEETYDIAMESPGNNYVANSFVVHNSDGMKRYIRELKPDKFEDIIAMVALYRPGPIQWIDSFVKRKNNLEKVEYLHPLAQKAMKETYGIPVYQEQVMQMSKDMCGFSGAEADTLRKAIGKKIPKLMREMKEKFISGAVERGVEQHKAEQIWTQLEDFAAYCFNKSHATCYAMIAYQTAYLKAHFPDCFMAALMTSDIDNIDRLSIEISESERMGMSVLPPDVNESFADFAVVKDSKSIRFGLGAIKNVGVAVAKAIVRERKTNGSFSSLENFLQRNGSTLNKKVLESMVKAGALDRFNERGSLYAGLELLVKYASQSNDKNSGNQISIFSDNDNKNTLAQLNLPAGANDQNEFLAWEKELLGLYLSAHPLKEFAETLNSATTPINEISTEMANKTLRIGGMIHEIKKITTKSSQIMAFIKLEDLTGEMEVVAFPSVFHERPDLWIVDKMVIVQGKVSDKDGTAKLLADRVFPLEMARNGLLSPLSQGKEFGNVNAQKVSAQSQNLRNNPPSNQKLFVIDLPRSVTKPKIEELRDMLKGYPGETPVELRIIQNGNTKIVRTTLKIKDCEEVKQSIDNLFGAQV
jgi:RNA recognition motif-containing protein